jgi:hypothetical protein
MTMEADLVAVLRTVCPRVSPDVAPIGTLAPYVTWQGIGGQTLRYADGTAADKRNSLVQINVWSKTRLEATALIHQIEDAMCATATLTVDPQGEALATYEPDTTLYGSIQRFSIYSVR